MGPAVEYLRFGSPGVYKSDVAAKEGQGHCPCPRHAAGVLRTTGTAT